MMTDSESLKKLDQILVRLDELERGQELLYEQVEALQNLHTLLAPLNAPLPPMRKWVVSPDFAVLLYTLLQEYQPRVVAELGGGVSTIVTGYFFSKSQGGAVNAFDHHPVFWEIAHRNLELHELIDVATVIHAPLTSVEIDGESWEWYDPTAFEMIEEIDFLTVDGPPQQDNPNPMARYPALPLLYDKLNSGAIILMDDTHREDEARIADRWQTEFNLTRLRDVDNEKGAIVFQKQ